MTFFLRSTFVAAATAAFLVAPVAAEAQSNRWLPYEGHMTVHFSIDHNGMSLTRGTFREIHPPERIVSTEKFDDPWFPGEAVGTAVLSEKEGRTTLTTTVRYESREIRDGVLASPMEQGMAAGYRTLDGVLESLAVEDGRTV